jgi:hypothetical protein
MSDRSEITPQLIVEPDDGLGPVAMVATYNLMIKYFTMTRDCRIITHDPVQVKQIADVFEAGWDHREFAPAEDGGLLRSNSNSRYQRSSCAPRPTRSSWWPPRRCWATSGSCDDKF